MNHGKLYLIPSLLADTDLDKVLPQFNLEIINTIDIYIVEQVRTARRFLKQCGILKPIDELTFTEIGTHHDIKDFKIVLAPCLEGKSIGLLSEAGLPCIADPGARIVEKAHEMNIQVVPLVGPSSLMLALMASGFNGQSFCFQGYLPIDKHERSEKIKQLEAISLKLKQTQIFIETPYRNHQMLESLLTNCYPETKICVAVDLTALTQEIYSFPVREWRKKTLNFHKRPAVFLLQNF